MSRVVVLAGVHDDVLVAGRGERLRDRRQLDELRAGADDADDPHRPSRLRRRAPPTRLAHPAPGVVSASVTADQRLAQPEVLDYWDSRHKAKGELQSGGDLGYDHPNNEIFYALRLGRLIDAVGDIGEPMAPVRVLDAGCGKGYFARGMGRFGHVVDGIDASPEAVEQCREPGRSAGELRGVPARPLVAPVPVRRRLLHRRAVPRHRGRAVGAVGAQPVLAGAARRHDRAGRPRRRLRPASGATT